MTAWLIVMIIYLIVSGLCNPFTWEQSDHEFDGWPSKIAFTLIIVFLMPFVLLILGAWSILEDPIGEAQKFFEDLRNKRMIPEPELEEDTEDIKQERFKEAKEFLESRKKDV